jgi:hypothetical protein
MSTCRISITTKIYIPSPFQKTIYWEYPHRCRRTTSTTYGQKYRFMFQRIKFLQNVIRNKSEDKRRHVENNISVYFLHSRLNMTPVVYRFLSLFAVFPFDFLSASPELTQLRWEINFELMIDEISKGFFWIHDFRHILCILV